MIWYCELHCRGKKEQQHVVLYTEKSCALVFQILGIFWNLWPEINCRVALTKVFLKPVSFVSAAEKFVTKGQRTGQPSLTTLTMNGFTKNGKHCFNFWKWSNLAWNSCTTLAIYFCFLPLCGRAIASLREASFLILTLGKWQNSFDNICFWKNLMYFWELK